MKKTISKIEKLKSPTKTLIVVESPAKAKTITKYLGDDYIIRASYGHIIDLAKGTRSSIGIDIENNFTPRYEIIEDKKVTIQNIIDAAACSKEILIASDPDREGEAIAHHLADVLQSVGIPIKRVKFGEVTKKAILAAVANPGKLDHDFYDAQQARRVLDRIVGYMVSPYLYSVLGPGMSAGRVQSVAVRLVVDREREIEAFKPEEYWNISTTLSKTLKSEKFIAKYIQEIKDQATAEQIKKDLDQDTYKVESIKEVENKRNPYPPLITSTLTISASGKYKFPAAKTMKLAQTLYENGHITYLRTDSVRSNPDAIDSLRDWLKTNNFDLPKVPVQYKTKNAAQDAHEAIRPTDITKTPDQMHISGDELKLYKLIWDRFAASQMNPAIYDTVSAVIKTSSNHLLKAAGRTLKYKGWLEITGEGDDDDEGVNKLPKLKVGDDLILTPKVKAEQKFTQPPPRFSEKTLLKELEKREIGRPSTYATIMTKITDRGYVEKKGEMFHASISGKKVIDNLVKYFNFVEPSYTAKMEERLDLIEHGKLKYVDMMTEFFIPFKVQLTKAYNSSREFTEHPCPICKGKTYVRHGNFGYFMACETYPECKGTISCELIDGKPSVVQGKFTTKPIDGLKCPKCNAAMGRRDGRYGPFYSCTNYPKCNGSRKIPYEGKKCEKCKGPMSIVVINQERKLACMGYPDCKSIEDIPGEVDAKWVDPAGLKENAAPVSVKKHVKTLW